MKRILLALLACGFCNFVAAGKSAPAPAATLTVREINYTARLAEDEARFTGPRVRAEGWRRF